MTIDVMSTCGSGLAEDREGSGIPSLTDAEAVDLSLC
jgi:hypothetical protein